MWKYEIVCGQYDKTIGTQKFIIIKSWNEFGTLKNKFKKVIINIPIEYANWTQLQFEN